MLKLDLSVLSNQKMSFSIFHYFGTLTFINITVRGSELRPRKKTTNYGYAFVLKIADVDATSRAYRNALNDGLQSISTE